MPYEMNTLLFEAKMNVLPGRGWEQRVVESATVLHLMPKPWEPWECMFTYSYFCSLWEDLPTDNH